MDLELNTQEAMVLYATLMTQAGSMRRWIVHSKDKAEIEDLRKNLCVLNDIIDKFIEISTE